MVNPKLKLNIEERKTALDLLADGHTVESAARHLHQNYHPLYSFEEVRNKYFPQKGLYAISSMQGKPKREINQRWRLLVKTAREYAKSGRRKLARAKKTDAYWEAHAAAIKTRFADPRIRQGYVDRLRGRKGDLAFKALQLAGIRRKLAEDPKYVADLGRRGKKVLLRLWKDPLYRKRMSKQSSRNIRKLWQNPIFRAFHDARTKLRSHRAKLERAVNFFEAQQPGGWDVETGEKERRNAQVAVHVPHMEEAIDAARSMRRMLQALPGRQRVLISRFFGIEMKHSSNAIREAQDLRSEQVQSELKAAMETLKQSPVWKKLLEE
ncbi:MAG: hypothetical protein Q8R15_04590 [Candidatus Micrarchaeota archaeon]|nr:hypothetical protein [Candidatus Micrarchaeota archaeon]